MVIFDTASFVFYPTHLLIKVTISTYISTFLYENRTMTCEVIVPTSSDGRTHARTQMHSTKVVKCGDYVELTTSGLDKNGVKSL